MTPRLSVICPTAGKRPNGLARTFDSIDHQPEAGQVEVIVVGDSHSGPLPDVRRMVFQRGPRYRYSEHDGGEHIVGQPQRQYGMAQARAPFIAFTADDNVFTFDAFASILRAIDALTAPSPLFFKVRTWQAGIVWRDPNLHHGNIDADCLVVPNEPKKLGTWQPVYHGDFLMAQSTAEKWGQQVVWVPDLISLARPSAAEDWTRQKVAVA